MRRIGILLAVLTLAGVVSAAGPFNLNGPVTALNQVTATGLSDIYDINNTNGVWVHVTENLTPPAQTIALVVTGTGNVTNGNHMCAVAYVTAGGIGPVSPVSNTVTVDANDKQVTVNIPVSTDAAVTGRNVYCTKATAPNGALFLVATSPTVANNTATTYTLNIADASFTATAPLTLTTQTATTSTATVQILWRGNAQSAWSVVGTITNPSATQVGWSGPGGGQLALNVSAWTNGTLLGVVGPTTKAAGP